MQAEIRLMVRLMKKICAFFAISLLAIGLLMLPVLGDVTPPPTLTITVLDGSNYTPVVGAEVRIIGPQNSTIITAYDGTAVFRDIPVGRYLMLLGGNYPMASPQIVQVRQNTSLTILYGHTKAYFTYGPGQPLVNETIRFDAAQSSSTGIITNYDWNFGDNTYGTNLTVSHAYTAPGQYRVSLTVTSTVGASTYTQSVRVMAEPQNNAVYLIILPLALPFILAFFLLRRRHYCIIIQARIPPSRTHPHCPGNGECDNCKVTPC